MVERRMVGRRCMAGVGWWTGGALVAPGEPGRNPPTRVSQRYRNNRQEGAADAPLSLRTSGIISLVLLHLNVFLGIKFQGLLLSTILPETDKKYHD